MIPKSIRRFRKGIVSFREGQFCAIESRPAFAAHTYYEVRSLKRLVDEYAGPTATLELGCGYGRLSPWINEHTAEHVCVDVNAEALDKARALLGGLGIDFREGEATAIPLETDSVGLVVTWTVLQHIPPESIAEAAAEIRRVLRPGGVLISCEETHQSRAGPVVWPRPIDTWEELHAPLSLVHSERRQVSPLEPGDEHGHLMVFTAADTEH